ncbi:MAG: hypothetical protein JXR69_03220, partial [Candidatus Delongbacteria bacterium]|nr:hypothetical protein [Candidatus Delongbacteria bacterium]
DSTYTLTVTAWDVSGNTDVETRSIFIQAPYIKVLTPATLPTETLIMGKDYDITWETNITSGNVKIELLSSNTLVQGIIPSTPTGIPNGSFTWTVNNLIGDNFKIRVSDASTPSIFGVSEVFSIIHSNDFESGLTYTNSGVVNWGIATELTSNCAKAIGESNGNITSAILTSGVFNGLLCTSLTLTFDQSISINSSKTPNFVVEYYNGTAWKVIYDVAASTSAPQSCALPNLAADMQIRFTANISKNGGIDSWSIDNIVVSGTTAKK